MKRIFPLLLCLMAYTASAQIDTEFWFAAPDATKGTANESRRDSTVFLVFSTLSQPSDIRIVLPANPNFTPIEFSLGANSTQTVNLGLFLSLIESKPANEELNTGILIRATNPITAYYEIRGSNNSDIFSLKGKNSLGTRFYTPFQTEFQNNQTLGNNPYIPGPRGGFIVMATQDNTLIFITPSIDILGHPANETFSINLDRGQTYYCEAIDGAPESKPGGSYIESTKPITVTVKDDMIDVEPVNDGGADIIGDQLISEEFLGTRHIMVKGDLDNNSDRVVVTGTINNTELYIDGSTDPIIINAGEQHMYAFSGSSSFLETSQKVAVFQVSGLGDQIAGAAIPSLDCTGSNQVGFVRGGPRPFFLNITIRAGSEDGFELNGDPNLVPASAFQPVLGSNGEYVFARISFTTSQIPVNQANLLTNFGDELFHVGLISGNSTASCNFGYFSAFSYLNIGENSEVCLGDSLVLDAGPGKTAYIWNTGEETQTITVTEPGTYYVDVFSGSDCSAADTIVVEYYEPPVDLGPNDTICDGTSLLLEVDGSFLFNWSDGSTGNSLEVSEEGFYWLEVSDFQECTLRDSIYISVSPRPETPELVGVQEYCQGEDISISMADVENAVFRYVLPSGQTVGGQVLEIENAQVSNSGMYYGYYIIDGCETFSDSLEITVNPIPIVDLGEDISICEDVPIILSSEQSSGNFEWQDGSTDDTFVPTESGEYYLTVTDEIGCIGSDTVNVSLNPVPFNPVISGDTEYCEGDNLILTTSQQEDAIFTWTDPSGNSLDQGSEFTVNNLVPSNSGTYSVSVRINDCFSDTATIEINVLPAPLIELGEDISVCTDIPVVLSSDVSSGSFEWQDGSTEETFVPTESGEYSLTVTNEIGCSASDTVNVTFRSLPINPQITGETTYCSGDNLNLATADQDGAVFTWVDPNGNITEQGPEFSLDNLTPSNSGNYSVSLEIDGCFSDTAEVEVLINPNPVFQLQADTLICTGTTITLEGPEGFTTYNWSTGETTPFINAGTGLYTLTVIDEFGCEGSDEVNIEGTGPTAAFTVSPDTLVNPETVVNFTDISDDGLFPIVNWFWEFGNGDVSNMEDPAYQYNNAGVFLVSLVVTDEIGCTSTANTYIISRFDFDIPQGFSPNGDGINDVFEIRGLEGLNGTTIQIFNRWGSVVFESNNYTPNNYWDGEGNTDGTYFYIIKLPNSETLTGNVTIAR